MAFKRGKLKSDSVKKCRIYLIDEIRGVAIICMVVFHLLYTVGFVFGIDSASAAFYFFLPLEPVFAGLFIFISGICTRLSRSNLRRGLILFFIAVIVNIFTAVFMPDFIIKFGILNLLSICMVFYGLFENELKHIPPILGLLVSIAVFVLTWGICEGYIGLLGFKLIDLPKDWYSSAHLYWIGFPNQNFFSSDYFPVFPWFFAFTAGSFFARLLENVSLPSEFYKNYVPLFSFIGRFSLPIYLLHQPVIFALAYVATRLI